MAEIVNCPVCGEKAVLGSGCCVECSNDDCYIMGPNGDTEAEAIAAWNTIALRYMAHDKLLGALNRCVKILADEDDVCALEGDLQKAFELSIAALKDAGVEL